MCIIILSLAKFMNKEKLENITKNPKQEEVKLETLPAVEVKNEVVWVNDKVAMPFVFEKGKPSNLGVFITPKPKEGEPVFNLGVMDEHFRSGDLGKVVFRGKDNPKLVYRDVDLNGAGGFEVVEGIFQVAELYSETRKETPYGKSIWGIMNLDFAEYDRDMSEILVEKGLRTHRVLAIIKLKELVNPEGNKISIKKAIEWGYIKTTTKPVVEVRAFGVKSRISDLFVNNPHKEKVEWLLRDAKEVVAREFNIDLERFSTRDYLLWLARTLGEQVAILHNNNYSHGYLTPHNITLDCRIVDLDSVSPLEEMSQEQKLKKINRDLEYVGQTLDFLASRLGLLPEDLKDTFSVSYFANLKNNNAKT